MLNRCVLLLTLIRILLLILFEGLLLQFDILGAVSVFASTIFVLAGFIPVGYAALTIVSAMSFSTSVYWTCRGWTELELCLK